MAVGNFRGGALLPWNVVSEELVTPIGGADTPAAPPAGGGNPGTAAGLPALSLVDRLAGPTAWINLALVFAQPLDGHKLRDALAQTLALFPTLACRASQDAYGEWQLCQPHGGALLSLGSSGKPLSSLVPPTPLPAAAPLTNLGGELFGHLEVADLAADVLRLLQVALVSLHSSSNAAGSGEGGGAGCVLGLRVSHLVGDFGTLRAALHHLAAAYSGRVPSNAAPQPAEPLISALAAAAPPASTTPWNYLRQPAGFMEEMMALVAAPPQRGLTLYFPPARLAALKAQALAEAEAAEAAAGDDGSADIPGWVSTNDALMAWLWKAFASLPCRRGAVTAFNQGLDMRGRLSPPPGQAAPSAQPRWLYGNLATSAFTPDLDVSAMSLGAVARALRHTVVRVPHLPVSMLACSDAAKFPGDLAHVAAALAGGARCSQFIILPVLRIVEAAAAGRPAPVMVSQCTLDYAADADFAGQLPVGAVPTFGRMVIPIAHSQPAPPAAGGGVLVHLWLPEEQARELAAAAEAAAATQSASNS